MPAAARKPASRKVNAMAGRIARGWEITKQSWSVLMEDKKLMVFPLLSTVSLLAILASFAVPVAMLVDWEAVDPDQAREAVRTPAYYAGLFLFYFINYLVVFFFNSALVACVMERFRGGTPTVGFGLKQAVGRLPQIVLWSIISATVGLILQMIAERSRLIGAIVARVLGAGWAIATYFAVPVIVVERAKPTEVFKRSLSLLSKSWGEGLVANLSMSFAVFIAVLLASIPLAGGVVGMVAESIPIALGVALIALTVLLWVGIALVSSTMRVILTAALYEYAATGHAPGPFSDEMLRAAFRTKKK